MITVIGAGPAGSRTAEILAKKGFDVKIIEEHKEIGDPVHCTGIVTSAIRETVKPEKECIINRVNNARIHIGKKAVELKMKNPDLILDRKLFDKSLAGKAEDRGAEIITGCRFEGFEGDGIVTSMGNFRTEKTIGADGAVSATAKASGMIKNRRYWTGIQARARLDNENTVDFFPRIGTYAWIVPEDSKTARIGVVSRENPKELLKNLIKKSGAKKIIEYQGGLIPEYNPKAKTESRRCILVGDAAAQVKATTGGGIIQSLSAAECAAEAIAERKSYEKLWMKRIGTDLWIHLKIRKAIDRFTEKDWKIIADSFSKEKNRNVLENMPRDYISMFATKLILKNPKLIWSARHAIL